MSDGAERRGAVCLGDGRTGFRVWAPVAEPVEAVLEGEVGKAGRAVAMAAAITMRHQ